ncbi:MAG TPA: hypothetical protein VKB88_34895 [Bryobacteraceae bacterium]|nr:hypothetical protein [Bryobacteraceae bacterium]
MRQFASWQRGIGEHADPQRPIDVFCDQINLTVVHHNIELNFGMSIEKRAKLRN